MAPPAGPFPAGVDIRVAAHAVVVDERGMLLAHWHEGSSSGWTLPGGGLEPGEDPVAAVVREVDEETTDTAGWFALDAVDALDRVPLVDVARGFAGLGSPGWGERLPSGQ